MSVAVKSTPGPTRATVQPAPLRVYRFTVKQYQRMIETGVLTEDDRVELLEGWIVDKMPHNPPHEATINRMNRRLLRVLPEEWLLRVQSAITLPRSKPEPDLAIVQGPEELYFKRHPVPRDIAVIIEIADTSLLFDQQYKGGLYARGRIPFYWIVNLAAARIEVYHEPRGGRTPGYRERQDYGKEASVPLILAGYELGRLAVRDLLP
ncbi:MAG TPA: Uma2 family endonuclease [Gemmataceae bacterium]|jgi:hypothetical protein|nr:Uma2 family endonuclease [Gemmataceae bacterium]